MDFRTILAVTLFFAEPVLKTLQATKEEKKLKEDYRISLSKYNLKKHLLDDFVREQYNPDTRKYYIDLTKMEDFFDSLELNSQQREIAQNYIYSRTSVLSGYDSAQKSFEEQCEKIQRNHKE